MEIPIADIRKEYRKGKLIQNGKNENPFDLFELWLNDAIHVGEDEPTAMIIATVSLEGRPSTRTVLLKGLENQRFVFYTNYESRKGKQLASNPYISLSFVWHKLERQVHIEGKAEKCSSYDSDKYFASRPYKSRIGARISPQSLVIRSRTDILRAFISESLKWIGKDIERPEHWGGFAVIPTRFEFWQGRENRLHDRIQFELQSNGEWKKERLAP